MKKKLALALLIGLSFFVLPQQVSANEIPPSLTYESLDKTTIRLFIQNSNSNREHRICPSILNKQNLDGSWSCHEALKLYSGQGLTYDYKLSYGNTDGFNVNSYDISTKQWSGWSGWHRFTNTNPNEPIVVLPTPTTVPPTTVPPTTVPASVVKPVLITGIYMYLNSGGTMDGDVYINWSNKTYSDSLYWTACPATTTWNPSNPDWSWVQSSYTNSGQTVFTGAVNEGVRCYLVSAKNSDGVLSAPTQVKYTYARWMAQPYSSSPKYIASNPSSAATSYGLPLVGTTGSICSDGWHSPSTGSGTCSWHGGIKEQYAPVIIKHTPITPIIIKPIKLPSSWFPKVKCYISCG